MASIKKKQQNIPEIQMEIILYLHILQCINQMSKKIKAIISRKYKKFTLAFQAENIGNFTQISMDFQKAIDEISTPNPELTQNFANLHNQITEIQQNIGSIHDQINIEQEPIKKFVNEMPQTESIWEQQQQIEQQNFLTNQVWPKSRMLLAIVSKMTKQGLITKAQRGKLKDLIIDNDQRILNYLKVYETDGNKENLYQNFINLAV